MSNIPLLGADGRRTINPIEELSKVKLVGKRNPGGKCQNFHDFKFISMLSHSNDSYVVKVEDKDEGEEYVLKKLKYPKESTCGLPMNSVREACILKELKHMNIVLIENIAVGSHISKNYIVLEYCQEDLSDLLENISPLNVSEIKCLMMMLLNGLSYLCDQLIMHRDICPANILIHPSGMLKIGDFGKARLCEKTSNDEMHSSVGTPGYRAPELILGCTDYTIAVDMWSFGCVFAELLNHKPLFSREKYDVLQMTDIIKLCGNPKNIFIRNFLSSSLVKGHKLMQQKYDTFNDVFLHVPTDGVALLKKCLRYNWEERLTPEACLNDDYFGNEPLALDPTKLKSELDKKRKNSYYYEEYDSSHSSDQSQSVVNSTENLSNLPLPVRITSHEKVPGTVQVDVQLPSCSKNGEESLSEGEIPDSSDESHLSSASRLNIAANK